MYTTRKVLVSAALDVRALNPGLRVDHVPTVDLELGFLCLWKFSRRVRQGFPDAFLFGVFHAATRFVTRFALFIRLQIPVRTRFIRPGHKDPVFRVAPHHCCCRSFRGIQYRSLGVVAHLAVFGRGQLKTLGVRLDGPRKTLLFHFIVEIIVFLGVVIDPDQRHPHSVICHSTLIGQLWRAKPTASSDVGPPFLSSRSDPQIF